MTRTATLELQKEDMTFSAGHFTVFSKTEREPLHGHNYQTALRLELRVNDNGMSFDYRYYKEKMRELCREIDQTFLLPKYCKYMTYEKDERYVYALFNGERIPFLEKDITLLPVRNITVEELSHWFLNRLLEDKTTLQQHGILQLEVKVYSGAGQWGSSRSNDL